jgi:hypothetical protein
LEDKTGDLVVTELSSFRQEVTEENLGSVREILDAASRDNNSRIVEINSRLDRLQEQITISGRHMVNQSADGESVESNSHSRCQEQSSSPHQSRNLDSRREKYE